MNARVTAGSIPKEYRGTIARYNKSVQAEISKRLMLSACLVGSDMFGWEQAECERFVHGLTEILRGYNEEVYRCRDNVGKIEDFACAFDAELRSRGIIIEFEE